MSGFIYPLHVDPAVGACGTISSSGLYTLNKSIYTTGSCFTISASNITLNGAGFTITGDRGSNDNGISISNRLNVTIANITINSFYNGITLTSVNSSKFVNITIGNSSFRGISLQTNCSFNNFTNITSYGNTQHGIMISRGTSNIFDRFITYNNALRGFLFTTNTVNNNVTNSTVYNSTIGIMFYQNSSGNSIKNSSISNNSQSGIKIENSSSTMVVNTFIFGNWLYGMNITTGSDEGLFENNTIDNNTYAGIYISGSNLNNFSNNYIFNNSIYGAYANGSAVSMYRNFIYANYYGLFLNYSSYSNLTQNSVENNSYGFYLNGGTGINISNNNATNNTYVEYMIDSSAKVAFSGINRAFSTGMNSLDLNISENSNLTTFGNGIYYNFTTEHDSIFFDSAINVSIKTMDREDCGAELTGCGNVSGICTLISGGQHIWNITNNSGSANIDLGMFYNRSIPLPESEIAIGKHTDSGYVEVGVSSIDTNNAYVFYDGLTHFSHLAVVSFAPESRPLIAMQPETLQNNKKVIVKLYNESESEVLKCPGNMLIVKTQPAVQGMRVNLMYYNPLVNRQTVYTENDGSTEINMSIENDGLYLLTYYKEGYSKIEDEKINFLHCNENIDININKSIDKIEEPPIKIENKTEIAGQTNESEKIVSAKISDIEILIDEALKSGKDIYVAKEKLEEAKEALLNADYDRALKLLFEAEQLAKSAKVKEVELYKKIVPDGGSSYTGLDASKIILIITILIIVYYFGIKKLFLPKLQ